MKKLLVVAQHPQLAESIQAGVNPEQYRVFHRATVEEAEPLLAQGLADACIVDAELSDVQGVWLIEKLRRHSPKCPVIIYTGAKEWQWEEEAYLQGAAHVLNKPVRPRLLNALLERLWPAQRPVTAQATRMPSGPPPPLAHARPEPFAQAGVGAAQTLRVLRDFSGILTHSLNGEAMLKEFLLLLREILSINRAAIFLRQPFASFEGRSGQQQSRRLRAASSVGISAALLEHLDLSFDAGIGARLALSGRILRRDSEEAQSDADIQKEFELLGAQVAVPILDREMVIGVAAFDGRITGEPLVNSELELIFHLLEHLGLAIKNIWLHDQLAGNHELLAQILRELSSACVVVSQDLSILHANKTARKYFLHADRRGGEMEFTDLPQTVGAKVYQVLKTGTGIPNFKYEPPGGAGIVYNVNVVPFQRQPSGLPASALLMADDLTQHEQLRRLEVEAANLRLVKSMADRLAHEVGNAMVPLSTHQQLLADKYKDPEFRASLDVALAEGVKRVTRLVNQMRFLSRDILLADQEFPVAPLIEEAFEEARKYQPVKTAQFKCDAGSKPIIVSGDRSALKHAFAEVLLNALQANPANPKIGVRLQAKANGNDREDLQIEVQDNGSGFTPEARNKASAPFFTTRNVGLGLGLAVTRKIVETHHGKLEILPPDSAGAGVVRISLPLPPSKR